VEEKNQIQALILPLIANEQNPRVSLHLAILLSRIAKFTFPLTWPQLLEQVLGLMRNEGRKGVNAMLATYHVVRNFARVVIGRRGNWDAVGTFLFVSGVWMREGEKVMHLLSRFHQSQLGFVELERGKESAEMVKYAIKILTITLCFGLKGKDWSVEVHQVVEKVLESYKMMCRCCIFLLYFWVLKGIFF